MSSEKIFALNKGSGASGEVGNSGITFSPTSLEFSSNSSI